MAYSEYKGRFDEVDLKGERNMAKKDPSKKPGQGNRGKRPGKDQAPAKPPTVKQEHNDIAKSVANLAGWCGDFQKKVESKFEANSKAHESLSARIAKLEKAKKPAASKTQAPKKAAAKKSSAKSPAKKTSTNKTKTISLAAVRKQKIAELKASIAQLKNKKSGKAAK